MKPNQPKRRGAKDAGKTTRRLLSYIAQGHKFTFSLVLIFILVSALANVAGSLFLETLIDDYITPLLGVTNPVFTNMYRAIAMMAGIYMIGVIATYVYNILMVSISQGIQKKIRDELFTHMQSLPIKYFDTHAHGDVMSRYTNDIDTLRQMLSQSIPMAFSSLVTIVSVFAAMLAVSLPLTLIVALMVALSITVTKTIGGKSSVNFVKQQQTLGKVNGYIEEMMHGQKEVKVFGRETESKERFDKLNDELRESATNANIYANILMPILGNLGFLQYALIAMFGGAMAVSGIGGLTLGAIASFLQLSRSFTMPVNQISQQVSSIVMALAGAERIFELMDEKPELDEGTVTLVNATMVGDEVKEAENHTGLWAWKVPQADGSVRYTQLTGDVRFFDVDFSYNPDKQILHDISLYAHPGEKVAFVGSTGAGKTTITNLINRFYDIQDGKIVYDGIDIADIKKNDLRRSLGIVLQDTNLFTGTILENIRYGNLHASDEEIYAAARLANADDFISRLPKGYQTVISGDGEGLSQGQKQLLSIARAAVADPPVMILDEATSSIDTRTESIVQRGMDALMQGRTVFVIAHRLSTIQNADVIMLMEQGQIIERGDHEKLIGEQGKYYQLYTGAFELE
ncbi:ABC transporter ATP-binding protein [Trichococcus paludicola]|uniref:ABC transporter ATP-binding protein n=1 Tax=Trichococcus paludicola TaxID=2052942 RepID=UPI000D36A27E|nr:ABC transporter ATP-binding protein [Trichococcus paludicola]